MSYPKNPLNLKSCLSHIIFSSAFILYPAGMQNAYANKLYLPVGYDAFCGLPVFTGQNPQIATAEKDQFGNKIIHIDPSALANISSSRLFTLAHECAHHKLGHTSALGEMERYHGGTRKQELEADCWAAKQLSAYNLAGDLQFQMLTNLASGHFAGGGYPSGNERAQNILSCASNNAPQKQCATRLVPQLTTVMQYRMIQQSVPCSHIQYGPYGPFQIHQFDVIPQQIQVPVQTTQMVEQTVCE